MHKNVFYFLAFLIVIISFTLRLYKYDSVPPFGESFDEQHYAFGGMTLLTTGIPKSWSWFNSYEQVEKVSRGGIDWDIKSPLIEKPLFYFFLNGVSLKLLGTTDLYEYNLDKIRILPLLLSAITTILVICVGKKFSGELTGLFAGSLYAVIPFIILSNRLSVTENLITPLALAVVLLLFDDLSEKITGRVYLILSLCVMAILTKQIGLAIPLVAGIYYISKRLFRKSVLVFLVSIIAIATNILIAFYYDTSLFLQLQKDIQQKHAQSGIPEMFVNVFHTSTISLKEKFFPEATILLGYILLISGPWLFQSQENRKKSDVLISFPLVYVLMLIVGESGSGPYTSWGWYMFPLLPFAMLMVGHFIFEIWQKPQLMQTLLVVTVITTGALRHILLLIQKLQPYWQLYVVVAVGIALSILYFKKTHWSKLLVGLWFAVILCSYTFSSMRLPLLYPNNY